MEELVFKSAKGNPVTTSLLVAEKFGKEHKNVIASIKAIIQSAENSAHFYYSTTYKDSRNRQQEMYIMNRDGFTLLVVGFTGPKALQFKLDYINAFNAMERQLKSLAILPNFKNPIEAARAWADAEEKRYSNVLRDIKLLIEKKAIDLIINTSSNLSSLNDEPVAVQSPYADKKGEFRNEYLLNEFATNVLAASHDPVIARKLLKPILV
jgi:Rha family phage regulatory protein